MPPRIAGPKPMCPPLGQVVLPMSQGLQSSYTILCGHFAHQNYCKLLYRSPPKTFCTGAVMHIYNCLNTKLLWVQCLKTTAHESTWHHSLYCIWCVPGMSVLVSHCLTLSSENLAAQTNSGNLMCTVIMNLITSL